MYRLW